MKEGVHRIIPFTVNRKGSRGLNTIKFCYNMLFCVDFCYDVINELMRAGQITQKAVCQRSEGIV
jgi:hypothetical protein